MGAGCVACERSSPQRSAKPGGFLSMATKPIVTRLDVSIAPRARFASSTLLADYWALTKPEVNFLILITTFAGFYLACANEWRDFPWWRSINVLLGTLLVASGTGTLNQYLERGFDAQMRRTARRPAAAGRVKPISVLVFGGALAALGSIYLAIVVNLLASVLAT